jgi:hypothetical protein
LLAYFGLKRAVEVRDATMNGKPKPVGARHLLFALAEQSPEEWPLLSGGGRISAELLAELREEAGESVEGMVAAAVRISTLKKRLADPDLPFAELYGMAREHLGEEGIAAIKAGQISELPAAILAKVSTIDTKRLQDAHDVLAEMGAACTKAAATTVEAPPSAPSVEVAKLQATVAEQAERLAKLEAQPVPSRTAALGMLRTVTKAEDTAAASAAPEPTDEELLKKFAVFDQRGQLDPAATMIKMQQMTGGVRKQAA